MCYAVASETATEKVKWSAEYKWDAATSSDLTICSGWVPNMAALLLGKASMGGADVNVS